jgi:hypothetical protein
MKDKPYARLSYDEASFLLVLSAVKASRASCFGKWTVSTRTDAKEEAFYRDRVAAFDREISRFEAVLVADKSQDAETDETEAD